MRYPMCERIKTGTWRLEYTLTYLNIFYSMIRLDFFYLNKGFLQIMQKSFFSKFSLRVINSTRMHVNEKFRSICVINHLPSHVETEMVKYWVIFLCESSPSINVEIDRTCKKTKCDMKCPIRCSWKICCRKCVKDASVEKASMIHFNRGHLAIRLSKIISFVIYS